ncbi:MAG TPA: hypothetical protein VLG45_01610 [Thermodesulfobacteriota bacterium]|nr:hypothetical protein [Thermodesulfobacteriota bacterium]
MIEIKKYTLGAGDPAQKPRKGRGTVTFYCVLHIDRFSNRILTAVFSERKKAEAFRNQSPRKLHIEPEDVSGYSGGDTLWCSNELGPGEVLSFVNLHSSYDAALASSGNGKPNALRLGDRGRVYSS